MIKKELINQKAEEIKDEMIDWRRKIHRNPELGFEEIKTSSFIIEKLNQFNIKNERVCDTGVVGLIEGKEKGKTIAIRADIDALAINEKNDLEYKSEKDGVMHACGHDGHTTILLGTAKVLSELRDKIKGNIKLIFQPAEEGPGGAKPLIEAGVLDNPDVDSIIGLHIFPGLGKDKIGLKKGKLMAAPDYFKIKIKGKGAHGAHPEEGVDPITVGSQIVLALQQIKSRETSALNPLVISCGSFNSGDAFNAVPEEAVITGTVRSFDNDLRKFVKSRIEEIVKNIVNAFRADYEYQYIFEYPPTYNDHELTDLIEEVVIENFGKEMLYKIPEPSMGGEDFSYYAEEISGTFIRLGTKNETKGITNPLHSPYFNFDEDILTTGVKLFVHSVNKLLE